MAFTSFSDVPPLQLVGLAGACTYIVNYILITNRAITTESPVFFLNNLLASTLVMISLADAFNMATALIQVFWVAVSLWGLTSRSHIGRSARRDRARRRIPATFHHQRRLRNVTRSTPSP
ncbi:MAG: hypothetical protein AAGE03_12055 [Pseudomonadota bacterium]